MGAGAITSHIDVAQLTLYAFFLFFGGLVFYLRREDKREGYPLDSDRSSQIVHQGLPRLPSPKTFYLADGSTVQAPRDEAPIPPQHAVSVGGYQGAPIDPVGDPLLAGVGPGSHVDRIDKPSLTADGKPAIVPIRVDHEFYVAEEDPDPRGFEVAGADDLVAGTVVDIWIDRTEPQVRFLEVETVAAAGARRVLLPIYFAVVDAKLQTVNVASILAAQFAGVPAIANPDQITLREEDLITSYYAAGHLYAEPSRLGPLL